MKPPQLLAVAKRRLEDSHGLLTFLMLTEQALNQFELEDRAVWYREAVVRFQQANNCMKKVFRDAPPEFQEYHHEILAVFQHTYNRLMAEGLNFECDLSWYKLDRVLLIQ